MNELSLQNLSAPSDQVVNEGAKTYAATRRRSLCVTVVDVNFDSADLLTMYFETIGHSVKTYYDAESALCAASLRPSHVFFIDIGMSGMDGIELIQRLKKLPELKSASFIAFSGYSDLETRNRAIEAGFDHFLTKPCSLEVFSLLLDEYMLHHK